ncbi:testis-expressed protein 54-like [Tachyglossus aculeatus]|uniref:testis-expressed protein 54-like n=1 Tax=Tachyglossus aculeatus TaxID=9261 RepID=UPI0018F279CE|nr:testis-expressed protein 54-like [Tachyglossus aculeatus]
MGCCKSTIPEPPQEAQEAEPAPLQEADGSREPEAERGHRSRKSNDSLKITVIWRRMSAFNRKGSARNSQTSSASNSLAPSTRLGVVEE